ncbi:GtrA family protein [Paraburkholderia sp. SARCC-3016]|uniref:GtrA family protein n=1 Tax=Paraburkholderia sp. SARCC-3016 TaxID=3058611 RepID=UPI002807064D|nr:GtrA family protein [Paraburkholderia sp. SARCC-3016]MDQ7976011.1 GtrA family protein [Paraburkholderia sp. SARCC-3016]
MNTAAASRTALVTWYALFALISMAANLVSQKIAWHIYDGPFSIPLAVCIGTGVGLIVKYALDKGWIFRYEHRSVAHGIETFMRYVVMGLATTTIFWVMEFAAQVIFNSETARLAGGALGLTLGYIAKYQLDKRFVFA